MDRRRWPIAVSIWSAVLLLGLAGCGGQPGYQGRSFADWEQDLRSGSPEVRMQAVGALTDAGLPGVPGLVAALGNDDAGVRWRAARALGRFGPQAAEAVHGLQALVAGDPGPRVRVAAADALGAIGEDAQAAIPELAGALEDRDPQLRASAALALGQIGVGDPAAVSALVARLQDGDPDVRASAAAALRDIGPDAKDAVPALVAALDDARPLVRRLADEALRRIEAD